MAEENVDKRVTYIRQRIAAAFPKLAGPKLDKILITDENK